MTDYIGLLKFVRRVKLESIVDGLSALSASRHRTVAAYAVSLVVATAVSLALTAWYARRIDAIIAAMSCHAHVIAVKSQQLAAEKQRSERLLHAIMPASVADQLMRRGQVDAQYFEQVPVTMFGICCC